jgi:hypothetical protein
MKTMFGYTRSQDGTWWRVASFGTITIVPLKDEYRVLIDGCYYTSGVTLRSAMNRATYAWTDSMNGMLKGGL